MTDAGSFALLVLIAMFPGQENYSLRSFLWENPDILTRINDWWFAACYHHDDQVYRHRLAHDAIYAGVGAYLFTPIGPLHRERSDSAAILDMVATPRKEGTR